MVSLAVEIYKGKNTNDLIAEIKDLLTVDKMLLVDNNYNTKAKQIIDYFGVYYCIDFFNEVYGWSI